MIQFELVFIYNCKVRVQLLCLWGVFTCGISNFSSTSFLKTLVSPLNGLDTLLNNYLIIYVRVCFSAFYSIALCVCLKSFVIVPFCVVVSSNEYLAHFACDV